MANELQSMFGEIGLFSKEEIIAKKRADNIAKAREMGMAAIERGDLGIAAAHQFGALIASKATPKIDPLQEKMLEVRNKVAREMDSVRLVDPIAWGKLSSEDKTIKMQEAQIKAMFDMGMTEPALKIMEEVASKKAQREKMELERRRIEQSISGDAAREDLTKEQTKLLKLDKMNTIYFKDDPDPNGGFQAMIGRDGKATYMGDDGKPNFLLPGQYSIARPLPSKEDGSGYNYGDLRKIISPSDGQSIRVQAASLYTQAKTATYMMGILDRIRGNTPEGKINIMGTAGGITEWSNSAVNTVAALARQAARLTGETPAGTRLPLVGDDGKTRVGIIDANSTASISKYLDKKSGMQRITGDASVGEELTQIYEGYLESRGIREDAISVEEWKAAVVRLAYARALSREPGAKQLSDNDFKNSILEIGAATTDPDAFRRVMTAGLDSSVDGFNIMTASLPDWSVPLILNPKGQVMLSQALDDFHTAFGTTRPSAGTPTTGEQANIQDMTPDSIVQETDAILNALDQDELPTVGQ